MTKKYVYTTVVRPGRYVYCRPKQRDLPRFRYLKRRLDYLVDPMLSEVVHGWRRRHSIDTAVQRITSMRGTLIGLDIVNFFPTVDQDRLAKLVRRQLPNGDRWWRILDPLLPDEGIPDGVPFANVLANLFLTPIDKRFPTMTRYGDNIVVVVERPSEVQRVASQLRRDLNQIGLATHEHMRGGVEFCNQILVSRRDGRIIHFGRGSR